MKSCLLNHQGASPARRRDGELDQELVDDLGLDDLFDAMASGDEFIRGVVRQLLPDSLRTVDQIRYRQAVLRDCLQNQSTVRELYHGAVDCLNREKQVWRGLFTKHIESMRSRSVEVLGIFLEGLTNLRSLAERARHDFESDGFGELFDLFTQELSDEYLDTMRKHLRRMELRSGVQLSAALGDENQGRAYRLHMPEKQKPGWWERVTGGSATGYTFKIDERDESGARALSELRARGIENAVHALAESADHVHDFLVALRTDLAFYLGCLNLHTALTDAGAPLSFPVPRQRAELAFAARDLRDVVLLLRSGSGVVGNDVESSGRPLVIVTGANQGGKSTFLRSCGIAQLMAQAGLFVTAESLSSSVCDRIFTHYRREEDDEMESGKFDEELRRLRNITESATAASMVLFNESFAATNESEGSEIALEVLEALCAAGVRVFCVTHMYALSAALARRGTGAVTFLRADRDADGNRSFRLVAGAPRPTSHGQDLYRMIFDSAGRSP